MLARRFITTVLVGAALSGFAAVPAGADPDPEAVRFANMVRGKFPGDDDQLVAAGRQACQMLYTGSHTPDVVGVLGDQYGATPAQANTLVRAARGVFCTQAPG